MKFTALEISDVVLVEPQVFGDQRGYFAELWKDQNFTDAGIRCPFVQDNQSGSRGGTLRGLHYQLRRPQAKLVRVVSGEIFDVAVDVRRSSPTFGQWVGVTLSASNRRQVYVPEGFAHGFFVLSDGAEITYKCSDYYDPESERTLRWSDPTVAIDWPIPAGQEPILSAKDQAGSLLRDLEVFP